MNREITSIKIPQWDIPYEDDVDNDSITNTMTKQEAEQHVYGLVISTINYEDQV